MMHRLFTYVTLCVVSNGLRVSDNDESGRLEASAEVPPVTNPVQAEVQQGQQQQQQQQQPQQGGGGAGGQAAPGGPDPGEAQQPAGKPQAIQTSPGQQGQPQQPPQRPPGQEPPPPEESSGDAEGSPADGTPGGNADEGVDDASQQFLDDFFAKAQLDSAKDAKPDGGRDEQVWDYMKHACFQKRYEQVAEEVLTRGCDTVVEVGGYLTPLDDFLPDALKRMHQQGRQPKLPKIYANIDPSASAAKVSKKGSLLSLQLPMTLADFFGEATKPLQEKFGLKVGHGNSCAVMFGVWDPHLKAEKDSSAALQLLKNVHFAAGETSDYAKNWLEALTKLAAQASLHQDGDDRDVDCSAEKDLAAQKEATTLLRHMRYFTDKTEKGGQQKPTTGQTEQAATGKAKSTAGTPADQNTQNKAKPQQAKKSTRDTTGQDDSALKAWFKENAVTDGGDDGSTDAPNWGYLSDDCMRQRVRMSARAVLAQGCNTVVEVGGYLTPLDEVLRNRGWAPNRGDADGAIDPVPFDSDLPDQYINIDPSMKESSLLEDEGMRSVHLKMTLADFLGETGASLRKQFHLKIKRPACAVMCGIWTPHYAKPEDQAAMESIWNNVSFAVLESTAYSMKWVDKTMAFAQKAGLKSYRNATVDCHKELAKEPWKLPPETSTRGLRFLKIDDGSSSESDKS
eukprot:TRINITY_DN17058_c0_g1_i1.p1 TRINITY_DN17058_c0_g1~~TRINITY_DN17058_c0_g1_i1.p1  ORF type:complete len:679 (+),score=198.15 TRINITY_DN17058_c0_g1_i1:121-2157(+)